MKVKITRHMVVGNNNPNFDKNELMVGDVLETSAAVGKSLVDNGSAVEIEKPAPKKKKAKKVVDKLETK